MKPGALIPSMFHRRLLLLLGLTAMGMLVLGAQLARLTLVQGADLRDQAQSRLVTERWTPTFRGRILDRKGRELAIDRPSYDLAVDYRLITGQWAFTQAAARARSEHTDMWPKLSEAARDALIQTELPIWTAKMSALWSSIARLTGVEPEALEERKQRVIADVQRMASSVWAKRLERERREATSRETQIELADVARPIHEQRSMHVILRRLDDDVAFRLRSLIEKQPDVSASEIAVRDAGSRSYPFEQMEVAVDRSRFPGSLRRDASQSVTVQGVATHMLGWMRSKAQREDMLRRPRRDPRTGEIDRGAYHLGDSVGASGVEREYEDTLRGLRGRVVQRLDTEERRELDAEPGQDVELTIDITLQARVQALLDPALGLTTTQAWSHNDALPLGTPLNSAAVVLDIQTGDVLAMATYPSFTRSQLREDPDSVFKDPLNQPWVNRPLARPYQPGSIVKPLVLVEAVTVGAHSLDNLIECTGHLLPDRRDIFRCWIYRAKFGYATHSAEDGGPLNAVEAITRSCNIYFYTLGRALGPDRIAAMYRRYGVGQAYEIGLPEAVGGFLGRSGEAISPSEAILMGIGQGPVSWTPLHAADAYATLARRGVRLEPRLVASLHHTPQDLQLDERAMAQALQGLENVVNDPAGTGRYITMDDGHREKIFNAPGVRVLGKTGTAQAAPTFYDLKGDLSGSDDNPNVARRGDHAWTVALVGPEGGQSRFAIAVVVEHGGSGGRVAGPIVNQIILALIAEGYLPSAAL